MFQEQLMTGERSSGRGLVDVIPGIESEEPDEDFEEPFYLVVLERTVQGTTVHMWRLIIASQPESNRKFNLNFLVTLYLFICFNFANSF